MCSKTGLSQTSMPNYISSCGNGEIRISLTNVFDDDKALALVVPRYHGIQMNSHSVPNGLELVQGKVIADVM